MHLKENNFTHSFAGPLHTQNEMQILFLYYFVYTCVYIIIIFQSYREAISAPTEHPWIHAW